MGQSLDKLERQLDKLGTIIPPNSSSSSSSSSSSILQSTQNHPFHSHQRINRCIHSFHQLTQDIKRMNSNFTKYFIYNHSILRFQIFSKLSQIELKSNPNQWKYDDNVIIVVGRIKIHDNNNNSINESAASAAAGVDHSNNSAVAAAAVATAVVASTNPPPFNPAFISSTVASTSSSAATENSSSSSSVVASSSSVPLSEPRHILSLTEFYTLYLYFSDNLTSIQSAFDRIQKLRTGSALSSESGDPEANECGICLSNQVEVVLECGHAFCRIDISEWHSKERNCPICRASANVDDPNFEVWDMLSVNEEEMEGQIEEASKFVHEFILEKPLFRSRAAAAGAEDEKLNESSNATVLSQRQLPGH